MKIDEVAEFCLQFEGGPYYIQKMILDPKNRAVAADLVVDRIRSQILDGSLPAGLQLRQDELCEKLQCSRTPVRQALRTLVHEGLVRYDDYKGARVAQIDRAVVEDTFDMRLALEPMALRQAIAVGTKVDWARAEMALDQNSSGVDQNWSFHSALYTPCARNELLSVIATLNRRAVRAEAIALSILSRPEASHQEHLALLEVVKAGDADLADACLRAHLIAARAATLHAIFSQGN